MDLSRNNFQRLVNATVVA